MIHSDALDALNAALSAAQGEFEAVDKSAANPFFKSSYAPLPEVVKAAAAVISRHGLAVWQGADTDEQGELLWTVVLHSSGQFIGSAARLLPIKGDPQAQGSAITYQRRYQYMAALGLVADEDDDGEKAMRRQKPSRQTGQRETRSAPATPPDGDAPVTDETLKALSKAFSASGATKAQLDKMMKDAGLAAGKKADSLTEDQATWVTLALERIAAERKSEQSDGGE